MFNLFKVCPRCRKRRFLVKPRKTKIKFNGLELQSVQPMCGRCAKGLDNPLIK